MTNFCGAVFSMNNAADNNQVFAYSRKIDGTLSFINAYPTGGKGTGVQSVDPLASQGSIITSINRRLLFVVNAGSNTITSFSISPNYELTQLEIVSSQGIKPNALAIYNDLLYVANAGDTDAQIASNISGFHIDCCGKLCPLPYANYALSTPEAKPASLIFSPQGDKLFVSELSTNILNVYPIDCEGHLQQPIINPSNGTNPFGSAFLENGILIVSEAGTNALSSYYSLNSGQLKTISASVVNNQNATCWISIGQDQQVAYTSNAGSNTISIFDINKKGIITLRKNITSNPNMNSAPIDNIMSCDCHFLYVLNGLGGSISVFESTEDGELTLVQIFTDTNLPQMGAQGIALI